MGEHRYIELHLFRLLSLQRLLVLTFQQFCIMESAGIAQCSCSIWTSAPLWRVRSVAGKTSPRRMSPLGSLAILLGRCVFASIGSFRLEPKALATATIAATSRASSIGTRNRTRHTHRLVVHYRHPLICQHGRGRSAVEPH